MTDTGGTPNSSAAMERTPSIGSNNTPSSNAHSLWSDYVNLERNNLVQEYPQLDRKVLGGFISNVLMRIAQNQDRTSSAEEVSFQTPDDEWQAALLSELSALRDYYPSGFRIFADLVSRIIRRGSSNGQISTIPYRPSAPNSSNSRRGSIAFSDPRSGSPPANWQQEQQRLPPISSLPQARSSSPDLIRNYPPPPLSPPKSVSPSSNPEEYHHHYQAAQPGGYYTRSGTDPHLFSLESSFLARPVPTRPANNMTSAPQLPMKRPAEDFPARQNPHMDENTVAAMLSEANALSAKLGNMAATTERTAQGVSASGEGRSLACLRCRRKKTRCNHARPTCSRCAHSGFKCEYPEPLPKPTDMASSIAKLQGQLQLLNSRIQAVERLE